MPTVAPRWETLACDEAATEKLAAELSIPPIVARLLCQRGLGAPEIAHRFLNPALDHLHDPMALADMGKAVVRVEAAGTLPAQHSGRSAEEATEGGDTDV